MLSKSKQYDQHEVLDILKTHCDTFQTRQDAAEALGVNRVFLWRVLEGKTPPTIPMLEKIGFKRERKTTYVYTRL